MSIAENLAAVRDRIARAATAASREPSDVKLVAVSKTKPAEMVREAYEAGQRDFGENYAQELAEKAESPVLQGLDITWHFIGHLQTNKAKVVARWAHVVQAVGSLSLVKELGKRAAAFEKKLPVLVEVNVGGEAQKHGASAGELEEILAAIEATPSLQLRGLMTMPPHDLEAARRAFGALVSLRSSHGGKARLPELSMGMSDDLEVAIASGATIVRVGTAIFGSR